MASATRFLRGIASTVAGKVEAFRKGSNDPKPGMDDVTLARKVETELFRDEDAPKGKVDVSAVDGVVELRGEVKRPDDVKGLEARARAIPEVRDVRNLLHLPKTPSPTRADSPPSHQKRGQTRRAGRFSATETAEREVDGAEPSPKERAATGEGRGPAPLGGDQ
ncbi:MAG: BON domain-containing protein [Actinomycetota bacterium]|nr:BON domain-containing protein [Actinomycetota bacterium]